MDSDMEIVYGRLGLHVAVWLLAKVREHRL